MTQVLNASAELANEVATDFVERGRFNHDKQPRRADTDDASRSKSRDTYHSNNVQAYTAQNLDRSAKREQESDFNDRERNRSSSYMTGQGRRGRFNDENEVLDI